MGTPPPLPPFPFFHGNPKKDRRLRPRGRMGKEGPIARSLGPPSVQPTEIKLPNAQVIYDLQPFFPATTAHHRSYQKKKLTRKSLPAMDFPGKEEIREQLYLS